VKRLGLPPPKQLPFDDFVMFDFPRSETPMFDDTVRQRVERYYRLSETALRRAEAVTAPDLRASYLKLAHDWKALAEYVERKERLQEFANQQAMDSGAHSPVGG
jgi:hypothetical protein